MRALGGLESFTSMVQRFWKNVEKTEGCWRWKGYTRGMPTHQYGALRIGSRVDESRTLVLAHRLSFLLHNGTISDGLEVCHHCDNPPCTRPDHLFKGTQADNIRDRDRKGRRLVDCKRDALGRFA